jgi:hypothetical protein
LNVIAPIDPNGISFSLPFVATRSLVCEERGCS